MKAANINADKLAAKMGINRSTIYHWRNGARMPSSVLQPELAKYLRTSRAKLNGFTTAPQRRKRPRARRGASNSGPKKI